MRFFTNVVIPTAIVVIASIFLVIAMGDNKPVTSTYAQGVAESQEDPDYTADMVNPDFSGVLEVRQSTVQVLPVPGGTLATSSSHWWFLQNSQCSTVVGPFKALVNCREIMLKDAGFQPGTYIGCWEG